MIEISHQKVDKMSGYVEDMLRCGGKLMQCLEELSEEGYGERMHYRDEYSRYGSDMGHRDAYSRSNSGHMGMREHDDWDGEEMGERRRRRANGRFY